MKKVGDGMTIEIGVLIATAGLLQSYLTYQFYKQKDSKIDTRQDAKIQVQLDYIGKGMDDIQFDLKANERQMQQLNIEVVRIVESNKSLHKRIDKLEGRIIKMDKGTIIRTIVLAIALVNQFLVSQDLYSIPGTAEEQSAFISSMFTMARNTG
ncbi:phage holin, partial [Neobacillus niacini]|uniref:phage holin n=1 Tax=Neobacillus niacini TaxID=86668 RepID=UPI002FFD7F84